MRGEHSSLITGIGDGRCQGCLSLWEYWTHNTLILLWKVTVTSADPQLQIWKVYQYGTFICICGSMLVKERRHSHLITHHLHCTAIISLCLTLFQPPFDVS